MQDKTDTISHRLDWQKGKVTLEGFSAVWAKINSHTWEQLCAIQWRWRYGFSPRETLTHNTTTFFVIARTETMSTLTNGKLEKSIGIRLYREYYTAVKMSNVNKHR